VSALPPANAAPFKLEELAQATGERLLHASASTCLVRGVVTDTRLINSENGPAFVCLKGEKFDGHAFAPQAVEAGAQVLVVERELPIDAPQVLVPDTLRALGDIARFHRERFAIPVVAVTGSYGKTTTRALIEAVLGEKFVVLAAQGNFNNEIGLPLTLLRLDETHQAAVLEMGMRGAGQIKYLCEVARPTIGVVTNIGPQHIELLGSLEAIAYAKAELLQSLANDGTAILPVEDAFFELLRASSPPSVVSFGAKRGHVRVGEIRAAQSGENAFALSTRDESVEVLLPLPGAHNALNAAAAAAVGQVLGVPLQDAARGLSKVDVPGARMKLRVLEEKGITLIDDCYNAGPNSMRAALQVLAGLPNARRRVAILGAMKELGDWADEEHRKIGAFALESGVQVLVGVGEETREMIEAAPGIETHWRVNASEAAELTQVLARSGDAVLVKGSRSVGLEKVVDALVAH
jgi:UDP-N-acetylmuramoyl-tripeptide--D-alanyl-D-alanine ligase